jgi:DNA uptake protein ComE-like DNA-binding protein
MRKALISILLGILLFAGVANAQTRGKKDAASSKVTKAEPAGLIDINGASAADLKTLPGIGDAYSAAIIKNRPYKNKTQLASRHVIPQATYEKIRDKVIAKQ